MLLDRAWRVKICDFGLSVSSKPGAGTPNYMAPELLQGGAYTDKVDVYAFGILLNEMLSRKPPFTCSDPGRITELVLSGQRPDVPAMLPELVVKVMTSCWHAEPQKRPSFEEVLELLSKVELA
jgi:serine/threonine protein kinase